MVNMNELVKVGSKYGKVRKKKQTMFRGKSRTLYLVVFKNGTKQWVFKSDMTLLW